MLNPRFFFKPKYDDSLALVIGINNYKSVNPLQYAVNDAEEFAQILQDKLSFAQENIIKLIDEEATRSNIESAYGKLAEKAKLDDKIIFYFAGHGHTLSGKNGEIGFLIPYDACKNNFSHFIPWNYFTQYSELIHAKHMLFIMDACYGGLALTRQVQSGSTRFLKDMLQRYSRQVLTAGKADEPVSDAGGPLPEHSVFTGHLIEGLNGKAAKKEGIITAHGLMAYVYGKVANDPNSNQTPHYGHFDGDGDLILYAPQLDNGELDDEEMHNDLLIDIPYADEINSITNTDVKVRKCKSLLSQESTTIELHDFAVEELKNFLSATNEDNFGIQKDLKQEEILDYIDTYEDSCKDLSLILACIAYWGKQNHLAILQKIFTRATDRLSNKNLSDPWTNIHWYPLVLQMYSCGIAAVYAKNYDALAAIFNAPTDVKDYRNNTLCFIENIGNGIDKLQDLEIFKRIPGHERNLTPMSEYLLKTIQPKLDDTLFIGKSYEQAFDDFEVLFYLSLADYRYQREEFLSNSVGRFGWKAKRSNNHPLKQLLDAAAKEKTNWPPLKAGLFGGDLVRFQKITNAYFNCVENISWH